VTEVAGVVYDTFADKATLLLYINLLERREIAFIYSAHILLLNTGYMHYILPKAYQTKRVNVNQHQIIGYCIATVSPWKAPLLGLNGKTT